MGRRSRRLRCIDCDRLFWTTFEHMTLDELVEFAETTECPHCDSDNWRVTRETMFSGANLSLSGYSGFQCRDCMTEFYESVANLTPEELRDLAQTVTCPDCETSSACRLTDQVRKERNLTNFISEE